MAKFEFIESPTLRLSAKPWFSLAIVVWIALHLVASRAEERMVFRFLPMECQTNIVVLADYNHWQPADPELTNVISNTNLFTPAERSQLQLVKLKYKNVRTNSGPAGSVFKGWGMRQQHWRQYTNSLMVACFVHTNSNDIEEIVSPYGVDNYIWVKYRTSKGDGYNAVFMEGTLVAYQEFKNSIQDGLWCQMAYGDESLNLWMRFKQGQAVGQFLSWKDSGEITDRTVFKSPCDLLELSPINLSMDWEEVSVRKKAGKQ